MHRHEPTTQHGRTTPGNVAHAGCTTATTCTPQHTRSDTHAWACEHARAHTAQLPAAEHDDIVGEHAHQAKKKSGSTCRNAKNLPPKKTPGASNATHRTWRARLPLRRPREAAAL